MFFIVIYLFIFFACFCLCSLLDSQIETENSERGAPHVGAQGDTYTE